MRWLLLAAVACSAPTRPGSLNNTAPVPGSAVTKDCPRTPLEWWSFELFPACSPPAFDQQLPLCIGVTCASPCEEKHRWLDQPDIGTVYTHDLGENDQFLSTKSDNDEPRNCTWEGDRLASCNVRGYEYLTHEVTRDAAGRITSVSDGKDARPVRYDDHGRVVAIGDHVLRYDARGWLVQSEGLRVEHDTSGHMTRVGDIVYSYDGDRLVRVEGPHQNAQVLSYDREGRLVTSTIGTTDVTEFVYDCESL